MSRTKTYKRKAVTTQITATYRVSTKIKEVFHTVEYTEQRQIPDVAGIDIEQEKKLLWGDVVNEIENQIDDILDSYK